MNIVHCQGHCSMCSLMLNYMLFSLSSNLYLTHGWFMERYSRDSMSTGGTILAINKGVKGFKKSGYQIFSNQEFLSIREGCFQKKSWVVVKSHFKEQSLLRYRSLRIKDRRMRFLPLFSKFDVVIISLKKDQNRPTQS